MTTTTTTRTKRFALTFAVLATLGLLTSCGSSDSGSDGAAEDTKATTTTEAVTETIVEISIPEPTTTTTGAETTTTAKAATTTTAAPKPVIGKIEFATALEPNGMAIDPTTEFGTDESVIYASVLMTSLPKGTQVEGEFQVDGATIDSTSAAAPADYTGVYLQFALRSGGTFEAGTYTFIASADGEAAEPVTFTVE